MTPSDPTIDLRYKFPCRDRLPDEVARGLPPWFLSLASREPRAVLGVVADRLSGMPCLIQLAKAVGEYDQPALVVGYRQAYLELSLGEGRFEVPWTPCSWLPSPWTFDPVAARRFLVEQGQDQALAMDDDALEHEARDQWSALQFNEEIGSEEQDADESIFVSSPVRREDVETRLKLIEYQGPVALPTVMVGIGGLCESPPGMTGSFAAPEDLSLAGGDCPDPSWKSALRIFDARNGDCVLVRSGSGEVAWWAFAEGRVKSRWKGVEDFLGAYAAHIKTRCPFDSYSSPRSRS